MSILWTVVIFFSNTRKPSCCESLLGENLLIFKLILPFVLRYSLAQRRTLHDKLLNAFYRSAFHFHSSLALWARTLWNNFIVWGKNRPLATPTACAFWRRALNRRCTSVGTWNWKNPAAQIRVRQLKWRSRRKLLQRRCLSTPQNSILKRDLICSGREHRTN